jgi:hypothetical protein
MFPPVENQYRGTYCEVYEKVEQTEEGPRCTEKITKKSLKGMVDIPYKSDGSHLTSVRYQVSETRPVGSSAGSSVFLAGTGQATRERRPPKAELLANAAIMYAQLVVA